MRQLVMPVFENPPVYLVADGMGGHRLGDVASAIVTERFAELAQCYEPKFDGYLH